MSVPHHTPCQTWEWGCHVQFHGPRWWWGVLGGSPIHTQEAIISFSIRHSGASAWLRGRRPLFAGKWSSLSPPLTFFILGANGWYAVWLIEGESHIGRWRFTNANSKLLCIHYSQSMPTQLSDSWPTDKQQWSGMWRDAWKTRQMPAFVFACACVWLTLTMQLCI